MSEFTTDEIRGLIERLNRVEEIQSWYSGGWRHQARVNPDGPEAATALTQLDHECELSMRTIAEERDRAELAEAHITELQAAYEHEVKTGVALCEDLVALRQLMRQETATRDARIAELVAQNARMLREATDARYMRDAYRMMLSTSGEKVAEIWAKKGVTRQHTSWSLDALSLTGEQRAAELLNVETQIAEGRTERLAAPAPPSPLSRMGRGEW